jgi:hypothetical protein
MLQVDNAASAAGMTRVELPACVSKDKWKTVRPRSEIAKLAYLIAPKPKELRFYPELPEAGALVWGLWPSGAYGTATYVAAWTFRTPTAYFNELPILAWHPV